MIKIVKNILSNIGFILKRVPNKFILLCLLLGLLSLSSFNYIQPKLIGKLIDLITKQEAEQFYKIAAIVGVLYFIKYLLSSVIKCGFVNLSQHINETLMIELLSKIIDVEMQYYNRHEKGYIQSRINEASFASAIFSQNTLTVMIGALDFLISAISMLLQDIKMSIVIFILMPFNFIIIDKHMKKIKAYSKQTMEKGAIVSADVFSVINDIEQIKVINDKERRLSLYKEKFEGLKKTLVLQGKSMVAYFEKTQLLGSVATILVLAISGYKIFIGEFTLGEYTTYATYSNRFFSSVLVVASIGITLTPILVAIERTKEFLAIKEENENRYVVLKEKINNIDICNLSFSYKEDCSDKILKNVNMSWKSGDKVLIEGVNGSGKTTLIKILLGLYPINSGKVLINNIPINDIDLKSLRANYSVMLQNSMVFSGKILDNIILDKNNCKENKLREIICEYGLTSYFSDFKEGFESQLSEDGSDISGGQNQLILFLRTILSNKPVLIFDEPTSNMDKMLKPQMLKIIEKYASNKLVIIVSHDKLIEKDILDLGYRKEEIVNGYSNC